MSVVTAPHADDVQSSQETLSRQLRARHAVRQFGRLFVMLALLVVGVAYVITPFLAFGLPFVSEGWLYRPFVGTFVDYSLQVNDVEPTTAVPFTALEAGLTDQTSIQTALRRVARLLTRFQGQPLYAEMSAAERYHEIPYSVILNGQPRNGLIDLLFRASPDADWTIAEFKTDRLAETDDLTAHLQRQGYDRQVQGYVQAIRQQMGISPGVLLIFLNVGNSIRVLTL